MRSYQSLRLLFKIGTIKSRQKVHREMFTTALFIHFLIHSSSKHLLSSHYVPGTVLGPRDLAVNKIAIIKRQTPPSELTMD